ncbi:hypothetical protein LIN78_12120 [Leeia sp. TBRC 13508]|uniref:Uncharacterized protein n=1 Tax=Leeia speluncae TaxID=2884804 RepID=A0ABS8D7V5_9NEIS|nr:hypothetical protein [Leeia speluncae]MCB6184291.1 hypothetical protein [Leeia speluncae]
MAIIQDIDGNKLKMDAFGSARVLLYDLDGNPLLYREDEQPTQERQGMLMMGLNDEMALPARADRFGSLASSLHSPLYSESFESATINPIRWTIIAATMAATQSSAAGLVVNSGNITTINTGYLLRSNRYFQKTQRQPLHAKIRARLNHFANAVQEIGFGDAGASNTANTNGVLWQAAATGAIVPVVIYNGSQITGADVRTLVDNTKFYTWDVFMDDDEAVFTVQDTSTGRILSKQAIKVPQTGPRLVGITKLPLMLRSYNTGTAPATAATLVVSDVYCAGLDAMLGMTAAQVAACQNRDASSNPFSGAQLAQWSNSAEPASAVLGNTAAGYATLGGRFQFAAVAGAVTDYALFGMQIPTPADLMITGVDIETWNTGAAVATTPTLLTWGLATNLTAVSLATTTGSRIGLGAQQFAVGAAVGAKAERISKSFVTPVPCAAGRYLDVILRMPVATATASQVIAGMVNIEGYFQ